MAGGSIGQWAPDGVFIGLGDAEFESSGAESAFEAYFVEKVQSLGYNVGSINEYFSSQMCPTCGNKCEGFGLRVKVKCYVTFCSIAAIVTSSTTEMSWPDKTWPKR